MQNIALIVAALALCVAVQIVWWRVRRPRTWIIRLAMLFAIVFVIVSVAGWRWGIMNGDLADYFRLALFYFASAAVYICLFSAVDSASPTLSIVIHIAAQGQHGCRNEQLTERFAGQRDAMMDRLRMMEVGGLIRMSEGRCELT